MFSLGIDIGSSTVKLVLLKDKEIEKQWMAVHHGGPFVCLKKGLSTLELAMDTPFSLCVTGSNTEALLERDSTIPSLGDIPAIVEGVRRLIPQAGSVIEIGSQGARFITELQSRAPQFSVNEHCAGGTGSFFEDQMSRVGCKLEDYSSLVKQAQSVPRLSGRCAVFAKTDIIHRQQEGVSTPDILLGLCYAMIRNYKATIVRRLPVCKPVVFCGGVTCNAGVIRAMQTLGNELGAHSAFAEDAETLFLIADSALPNFSGGNGRYRYAKAVELSNRTNAVLTLAPRYENTAMILDMRGLHDACRAPLFQISLDNDWDETAWSRLRSFLYYC